MTTSTASVRRRSPWLHAAAWVVAAAAVAAGVWQAEDAGWFDARATAVSDETARAMLTDVTRWDAATSVVKAPDHPVEQVSWDDTGAFCAKTGLRLPTVAEWEYACRAGTTTPHWSGDTESDGARVGWCAANHDPATAWMRRALDLLGRPAPKAGHRPVAAKPANPFGLHDVHGNVREWCEDRSLPYSMAPATDPIVLDPVVSCRVSRGGDWWGGALSLRSASRDRASARDRGPCCGFRPARSVAP